jgi:hypothetical protein
MRIEIKHIKVAERIRKLTAGVDALAADIQKNGLINPITVMTIEGDGEYQLLAGLRRLRAAQALGWEQIAVTVVAPKDAEAALNIEYSENVQREAFTYSEKMDYARLIAEIEKAKAHERRVTGGETAGRSRPQKDGLHGSHPIGERNPRARDIIGGKIGMSGQQYDRAKYVADHAPQEVIEALDRGERTIRSTYDKIRAAEKRLQPGAASAEPSSQVPAPETNLERAIRAESELDAFKYRQHNEIFHRDNIIESLKKRVAELEADVAGLEAALEAANARIQEMEGVHATTL